MADDEFVWMHHTDPDHDGYFQCPAAAVPMFKGRGWEVAEAPVEVNPVTAERNAWLAEQAATAEAEAAQEAEAADVKPARKAAAKSTTKSATRDESKE